MTAFRRHLSRWALLIGLAFALAAIHAPANACQSALADVGVQSSSSCTPCSASGESGDPGDDGWSCAVPCTGSFVPVAQISSLSAAPPASPLVAPSYGYVGWAAPPVIPPPRSA